jgi:hypothetical protein
MNTLTSQETLTKAILTCMNKTISKEKTVIIGDIHGRTIWKEIVKREQDATQFVFLGDYFDPYNTPLENIVNPYGPLTPERLVTNFTDILDFKKNSEKKVILLVGNHDLHYMAKVPSSSRYNIDLRTLLSVEVDLKKLVHSGMLQLCSHSAGIWYSHAGFSNTWLRDNRLKLNEAELNGHFKEALVADLSDNPYGFVEKDYATDIFGDDVYQGPLWIRPKSVKRDCPVDIYQIVGHTQNNLKITEFSDVVLCDSLTWNTYYVYEVDRKINGAEGGFETKVIE